MTIAPAPAPPGPQLAAQLGRAGGARAPLGWHDYRVPILVWAWSRLLTLLAVAMVGWVERPRGSGDLVGALITPLRSWDGFWYLSIAQYGYDPTIAHGNTPAFFPLYPLTVSAAEKVLPFSYAVTGVIVSNLLFLPALMVLYRLTRERFGDGVARRTITYLSISPLSFVFSMVYTESLALLLICTTFLLLERRRIWARELRRGAGLAGAAGRRRCWRPRSRGRCSRTPGRQALVPAALAARCRCCWCRWRWSASRRTSGGAPARRTRRTPPRSAAGAAAPSRSTSCSSRWRSATRCGSRSSTTTTSASPSARSRSAPTSG